MMFLWDSERPRHRRDRNCYSLYQSFSGYGVSEREYEDLRFDHISLTRRRRRTIDCSETCLHCREFREPYELLRHYSPLADLMEDVHDSINTLETGRFIAQEVADKCEALSRAVSLIMGFEPMLKPYSGFLKQLGRDVQLLPDNSPMPPMLRPRRRPLW